MKVEGGLYGEDGGFENYKRGPILDETGRYITPIDFDTSHVDCPFCHRHWPEAPHVALHIEDKVLWIEGIWIHIRRKIPLQILSVLMDSFGRFITREQLLSLAFSDEPDCDMPDVNSIANAISYLRDEMKPTKLTIQNKKRHGYRLTTRENADDFDRLEREQAERLKAAQLAAQRAERLKKHRAEQRRRRKASAGRSRDRDIVAMLGTLEED